MLALAACVAGGCGSRYRATDCPGNPLPEPKEVLRLPGFDRLRYFRGTDAPADRIDYETWADGEFEFAASLTYHYPAIEGRRSDCARGASLSLRHPATDADKALRREFVGLFARRLGANLAGMLGAAAAREALQGEALLAPQHFELGPLVGELRGVESYHRGTLLVVGFYDRAYDAARRPPP
jgi:hypothetical protein